jgi:hypothetical protein
VGVERSHYGFAGGKLSAKEWADLFEKAGARAGRRVGRKAAKPLQIAAIKK